MFDTDTIKYIFWGLSGEMAQQLRALAALPEDPGLVPSTPIAHHRLQLQI